VGAQGGAFGVEGVEFAKDGLEGALASSFFAMEHAPAFTLLAEVGLNGFVVVVGDADELGGESVAKDFKFVQFGFEGLSLAGSVPFANDGLEGDIGAERDFVCAGADLNRGSEGFVELLPAFVWRPILCDVTLGEVDEVEGPPFFDFEEALEGEGVEESELPVIVLREFFEHRAHGGLAVGLARIAGRSATGTTSNSEELGDEELGAAAIDFQRCGVGRSR
jgi:hypothetical protein